MQRKVSNEDLKKIQFNILKEFDEICRKNKFNYSLIGGTLLGAVRHKGFIPWDDDIDVCMPRDDYNQFVKYCTNNETRCELFCSYNNKKYSALFAKFSNKDTFIVEHVGNRDELSIGVHIDIFIYDAMGEDMKSATKKFNKTRFKRELLIASNWRRYSRSKTHSWYYEPIRLLLYIFSRFVSPDKLIRRIEKEYSDKSFYTASYVANLASDKRSKSIIDSSCFDKYIELEFEGEPFKVLQGYETYLKTMYGDYMKLPPEKKRITHHTFDAFYKE